MSKLNYAKIRNAQKKSDLNPEVMAFEPNSPMEGPPIASGSCAFGEMTPYPNASTKIESSNLTNLFGNNVHLDNLDYINSLLKDQAPNSATLPQRRKRNKTKTEDPNTQEKAPEEPMESPKPSNNANNKTVPSNTPSAETSPSLLSPYNIDQDMGLETKAKSSKEQEWAGLKVTRNLSNGTASKDVEMYTEYFQNENNEVMKRSMSVEDIRITKRDFSKASAFARASILIPTEADILAEESLQVISDQSSRSIFQGNNKANKADFCSKLTEYINYFQKSEALQGKVAKSVQNFGGLPSAGSYTHIQKSGQPGNAEKLISHIKRLQEKVNDLQLANDLLLNEKKIWKRKEHELLYRAENAEKELEKYKKKNKKYKEELRHTQELLQREKVDNENNLLALRRVLANGSNISTVLEHKIHHYMNTERDKSQKHKSSASNSQNVSKKGITEKDQKRNTKLNTVSGSIGGNHERRMKSSEAKQLQKRATGTLKDKLSPLLSLQDQTSSEDGNIHWPPERLTTLSKSEETDEDELRRKNLKYNKPSPQQSEFETSSELAEEIQYYFHANQQEPLKKLQQIKQIQNQLSKLMENDESGSQSTSQYTKSTSQRNYDHSSTGKQHGNPSSYYNFKGREAGQSKALNKYENYAKMYHRDVENLLSPNEDYRNPSVSSNSESDWTSGNS